MGTASGPGCVANIACVKMNGWAQEFVYLDSVIYLLDGGGSRSGRVR